MFESIRNFYGRFERPISSVSLILGFVFDALTLRRVDELWENFWILLHIVIIAVFIALIHIQESEAGDETNPKKKHFWYVNILQFFFGGILSAFLVFYFRSSDIFVTWPFILLLAGSFIANESLKRHYVRFSFQISLFYLSVYSFAIYLLPVLMHRIGDLVFIFSGICSLVFITLFILTLFYFIKKDIFSKRRRESKKTIVFLILGITIIINFLYFTNLIPPIPLSLKDAEVAHSISKNSNGDYDMTYQDYGWKGYFNLYPEFTETPGSTVYAFSAIFSPNGLDTTIIHEWQYYDETQKKWLTEQTIPLPVVGGRYGGFRTYSLRSNPTPGKWRVNVKTVEGQTIGSLRFSVVQSDTLPVLSTETK